MARLIEDETICQTRDIDDSYPDVSNFALASPFPSPVLNNSKLPDLVGAITIDFSDYFRHNSFN